MDLSFSEQGGLFPAPFLGLLSPFLTLPIFIFQKLGALLWDQGWKQAEKVMTSKKLGVNREPFWKVFAY